jgi:hypothetical protein
MDKVAREKAFVEDYNALVKKHGLQLSAVIQPKSYGSMLQIEPGLAVIEIDGWEPESASFIAPAQDSTKSSNILND